MKYTIVPATSPDARIYVACEQGHVVSLDLIDKHTAWHGEGFIEIDRPESTPPAP